ncbi:hypothetical protein ABMA28_003136 [Loxostege sticticalis]|uniref:Uncharacterized protein n=1 Tax=Loxostege sticticalis TaxID=481309 RepID=A0ABD0SZI3_LOXSC
MKKLEKNVNKKLRNTGKQYVSRVGKIVKEKVMKPPCGPKCRQSCSNNFTNQQRQEIFDTYWELGSFQRQRDFLNSCITSIYPVCRRLKVDAEKHRKPNFTFYLVKDGLNIRVCKQFLHTSQNLKLKTLEFY